MATGAASVSTSAASLPAPESLWRLAVPPVIWGLHFLASWAVSATACGRWGIPTAGSAALVIAAGTAAALLALMVCLSVTDVGSSVLDPASALDDDTPFDRRAFIATTNALLVIVSAIAVLFVAGAAALVPTCQ